MRYRVNCIGTRMAVGCSPVANGEIAYAICDDESQPVQGRFFGDPKGAFSGEAYLARWKKENGED